MNHTCYQCGTLLEIDALLCDPCLEELERVHICIVCGKPTEPSDFVGERTSICLNPCTAILLVGAYRTGKVRRR